VRGPVEPVDEKLKAFYDRLLHVLEHHLVRNGQWQLLECVPAWEGNASNDAFIAYAWQNAEEERLLVTVNYAPHQSQCYVKLPFAQLEGQWRLRDLLSDASYDRDGSDLHSRGLYLDVPAWHYHIFEAKPIAQESRETTELSSRAVA
jgi:hypothetical protein